MLVDPQTRQGVQFIREWGLDSNKTVLNYTWVKKSLMAGRPLFEEDEWGECVTYNDGVPIDGEGASDATNEDVAKFVSFFFPFFVFLTCHLLCVRSPLPTPRVTPDELARLRSNIINTRQPSVSTNSQADDFVPATATLPHTNTFNNLPFSNDVMRSQPSTAGTSVPGYNPLMFMENNAMPNMPNLPSSMMALTAQAMQAMMANMLMNASVMPNPNFANDAFMLALQDSMRIHGVANWQGTQIQTGASTDSWLNQPVSPMREPPLPYPRVPPCSNTEAIVDMPSPQLEPSVSRRASSSSEFISGNSIKKRKGKERSISPSHNRHKISSSSAKSIEMHNAGSSMNNGLSQQKLFTEDGKALRFFVQIEIHHRFQLISSIKVCFGGISYDISNSLFKKNGGIIVDSPSSADYAVLYSGNQRHNAFKKLLSAAQSAGIPAVQAKFVNECVAEKRLLESGPFVYQPESTGKRKRSKSAMSVESEDEENRVEKRRLAKNSREVERRTRIKMEKEKEQEEKWNLKPPPPKTPSSPLANVSEKDTYPRAIDGPRTPTPPQDSREICSTGYRFSQAENEFALRYAKILIDRDHTVSQSVVISAIHEKVEYLSVLKSMASHFA